MMGPVYSTDYKVVCSCRVAMAASDANFTLLKALMLQLLLLNVFLVPIRGTNQLGKLAVG
jgi:hypothetical protein